jgi:hypothetical protein
MEAINPPMLSKRANCDVIASNKHGGLLEGRENLYPKGNEYLRPNCLCGEVKSEKFTPAEGRPAVGSEGAIFRPAGSKNSVGIFCVS